MLDSHHDRSLNSLASFVRRGGKEGDSDPKQEDAIRRRASPGPPNAACIQKVEEDGVDHQGVNQRLSSPFVSHLGRMPSCRTFAVLIPLLSVALAASEHMA